MSSFRLAINNLPARLSSGVLTLWFMQSSFIFQLQLAAGALCTRCSGKWVNIDIAWRPTGMNKILQEILTRI